MDVITTAPDTGTSATSHSIATPQGRAAERGSPPVLEWSGFPSGFNILAHVRTLCGSLAVLNAWTWRIVRARYQQSILGWSWSFIQPAATVAILSVVFTRFVHVETNGIPYVVFSFTAFVPWTLLSGALTDMVSALVDNLNLVTKVHFPREILPLAALAARLLDFALASCAVVALLAFYSAPWAPSVWLWLPAIVIVQLTLTAGLGLAGAVANVFYRDVKHAVALGLQVWLYASPIVYPATLVPERLRTLYYLNPMAGILEAYRAVLLRGEAPDSTLLTAASISASALIAGYVCFKFAEPRIADVV